jgi:phosphomethylpyrimidine synthase
MKITQEVREFARLQSASASALPLAGEGDSPAASGDRGVENSLDPEAGMTEMSKRFHEEGGEIYIPSAR